MVRIDAVLVALAVASALGGVASQHQARRIPGEYERAHTKHDRVLLANVVNAKAFYAILPALI